MGKIYSCRSFLVGLPTYRYIFDALKESVETYARDVRKTDFQFYVDFFLSPSEAFDKIRTVAHDIYFIDASYDTNVRLGRTLGGCIRDHYPGRPIVGISAQIELLSNEDRKNYDRVFVMDAFLGKDLAKLMLDFGFLPRTEREIELMQEERYDDMYDEGLDRLMKGKARKVLEDDGW